ncbi:MAG: conjugal transfer protein TraF [Planctomycetes bacterium]|nr:conjugal transfer protein TraF [Planctomycetota bacterium]
MRYWIFATMLLAAASPLAAEEWIDFNARDAGFAGMGGAYGRDGTGAYYNPANTSRRPWEGDSFPKFEIDLPFGVTGGLHGRSFNNIFQAIDLANELHDRFQAGDFNVASSSLTTEDIGFAMGVIDALDGLSSLNGEGVYITTAAGLAARFDLPVLPRAGISIFVGAFGIGAVSPIVDLDSLRGYRLTDESGAQWDQLINIALANSGGSGTPQTAGGQGFQADLEAAGYPTAQAAALARVAEDAGVNFGGKGSEILLDFLVNTRNGTGQSLESGANPLEGNKSGFLARGLAWYELGVNFATGLPLPWVSNWLSLGVTVKYMQAYTFNQLLLIEDLDSNGISDTFNALREDVQDAYGLNGEASRSNVGIDLGIVFTPQIKFIDTLALSVSVRNVNGPEFRWKNVYPTEPILIRFDPQIRAGFSYSFFTPYLPLTLAAEMDINRVSSDILPGYSTQFLRAGVAFDPSWKGLGFTIRAGALKNFADADEKWTLTAATGVSLFFVRLDVGAQMALDTVNLGSQADNQDIPQRASFYFQLTVRINW